MRSWFSWTLLAVVCWGVWALLARLIGEALTPSQQQAWSTLGLLPVMGALAMSGRLGSPGRSPLSALCALGSGLLTCLGNIAYYAALNRGAKAAAVVPFTALYPVVTVLLALLLLRERMGTIQWAGLAASVAAIVVFNIPDPGAGLSSWLLLALIPIVLWGVAALLQKIATRELTGERATLWFLGAFVPVAAFLMVRDPLAGVPTPRTWGLVVLLGLTFALGNFALLAAFARHGKASVIAPLAGLYPLVSIPLAMVWFGERLGGREQLGIVLALTGVIALAWEPRPEGPAPGAPTPDFPS